MINVHHIVVFDFETGGLKPGYNEVIQVAGKVYNPRSLEPIPPEQGGEFSSMMSVRHPERLEEDALRVNKKTREQILAAPDPRLVWNDFVEWVGRFNPRKTAFTAPIAAGKNIRNFDLLFARELCLNYCPKGDKTVLFNNRRELDLEDYLFSWFEGETEPENERMDTVRDYFGMSKEGAHDALVDVRQTGELLMKFLKLHRRLQKTKTREGRKFIEFKGCFQKAA